MRDYFNNNAKVSNGIVLFLIFFFISQPVFAIDISQYSSAKQFTNMTGTPVQGRPNANSVKSFGSNGVNTSGAQNMLDPTNAALSQAGQLVQLIQVHVVGDVVAPGVFKTILSTRASEVIQRAMPNRASTRVYAIRDNETSKETSYDLYRYLYHGDLSQNPYLKDGDVVRVSKPRGTVQVEGPVARPGTFELSWEKNLEQVLALAGGVTSSVAKQMPIKIIRFTELEKKQVLNVVQEKKAIKEFKIRTGDIVVVPDVINANNKFDYSVETIPGENMVYPTSVANVFVIGAVVSPGPLPYQSQLQVKDYIGLAGANADSNSRHVSILRGSKRVGSDVFAKAQAGDVIVVKQRGASQTQKYLSIVSVIASLAMTGILIDSRLSN